MAPILSPRSPHAPDRIEPAERGSATGQPSPDLIQADDGEFLVIGKLAAVLLSVLLGLMCYAHLRERRNVVPGGTVVARDS
ncbi:hypothetical protein N8I84_14200 [Streptomyces cynarae]|uniref:Uncharacterized protein n=1 Tax=Streptomyces cynarae TaxID=2981134 RepID=A0ABY6DZK8_9ACTN|nr:hypothetical protein [Streptomyces cynarae]UXY19754.1 hypothetical protein N8I84_14200 [Streptomyces cynarae]